LLFYKLRDGILSLDQVISRIEEFENDFKYQVIDDLKDNLESTCTGHNQCLGRLLGPFGIKGI
jgi:hypothetical protein